MAAEDKYLYEDLQIDADMSGVVNSPAVLVAGWNGFSVQSVFTGTPVGELKIQISCDLTNNPAAVTTWDDIGDVKNIVGAGSHTFVVRFVKWKWFRLVYTPTSGTGLLTSRVNYRNTY